jgi:hypothetical protein
MGWVEIFLDWAIINIFFSGLPIFITVFLPLIFPPLTLKQDEIIVAIAVTAISIALTNSQFPDEIKDINSKWQKWLSYSTNILTYFCLVTITVFSLREFLPGLNINFILSISLFFAFLGVAIGFSSYLLQFFARDRRLARTLEGYAKEVQEESKINSLTAKSKNRVDGMKI